MNRKGWKLLLVGGAIAFLVIYGIEMSTAGIERIYGPVEGGGTASGRYMEPEPAYASDTERRIAQLEKELAEIKNGGLREERLPGLSAESGDSAVDKLAHSASGLLQTASSKSIRFVASLFGSLME